MHGTIIRIISNLYTVSSNGSNYECRARGLFKNKGITPLVGDKCIFDNKNNYILEIEPRKTELTRPNIANVDAAIVVTSCKRPDFSAFLLDKMLVNVMLKDVEPIVLFTKYDLLNDEEKKSIDKIIEYYNKIGIHALINTDIGLLLKLIKNKIVCLTGQTGVGKSTFLNKIDPNLDLRTNDISDALGRGKHTTRHVELYRFGECFIADTPGFSALDVINDVDNIKFMFPEFDNDNCKFRDCKHMNEIGCKVIEQYKNGEILNSRYENYKKMVMECK